MSHHGNSQHPQPSNTEGKGSSVVLLPFSSNSVVVVVMVVLSLAFWARRSEAAEHVGCENWSEWIQILNSSGHLTQNTMPNLFNFTFLDKKTE